MSQYPAQYQLLSNETTKRLNVVVQISGLSTLFSLVPIYEKIRYGDPRIQYGGGAKYGGLILVTDFKTLLQKSGLTISQKIEPEQARGSVSTISLSFIDKDGYMTELCSPGVLLDEPLGNKLVTVYLGYQNSAYPDDYTRVFRGYISKTQLGAGVVTLELSDANIKTRQTVFVGGANYLSAPINNSQTNIPISVTDSFVPGIAAPDGSYDWQMKGDGSFDLTKTFRAFLLIESEWMEYRYNGIAPGVITTFRGTTHARSSTPAAHGSGVAVSQGFQLYGNPIDLILKIYLSGYGGPWLSSVSCVALGTTLDPLNINNSAVLFSVDVVEEYGLTEGDQIIVSGSGAGNNGNYTIDSIEDSGNDTNRIVVLAAPLVLENPAPAGCLAFRSQYDTLPKAFGLKNTPQDIDVAGFQAAKSLYFSSSQYTMQLFLDSEQQGKDFVESEIFLPIGAYSITRNGRLSIAITKPPLADEKLLQLDQTNVLKADTITVVRALNNRRFYNFVQYNYDVAVDNSTFTTTDNFVDATSATKINLSSLLPINSLGLRTANGGALVSASRGTFLLNRFKKAAYEIGIKVNWKIGSQVEIGDMVLISDSGAAGTLQISNLETGKRGIGKALFEVIGRSLRIAEGYAELTLLSSLGYTIDQRYATIAPSSQVVSSPFNSTTAARITESFGAIFKHNEPKKWQNFVGQTIRIHSPDYTTRAGSATFTGFDAADTYLMRLTPALAFTPQPGDTVEVDNYGTGTDQSFNEVYKRLFAFIDPSLTVTAGTSQTVFSVSAPDAAKLNVGLPIIVHNTAWSQVSPEVNVLSVVGTTVTVAKALGFTPTAGEIVDLVGFKDGNGPYRIL